MGFGCVFIFIRSVPVSSYIKSPSMLAGMAGVSWVECFLALFFSPFTNTMAIICVVELDGLAIVLIKSMCFYSLTMNECRDLFFFLSQQPWASTEVNIQVANKVKLNFPRKWCALPWNEMLKLLASWILLHYLLEREQPMRLGIFFAILCGFTQPSAQKMRHKFEKKQCWKEKNCKEKVVITTSNR